MVSVKDIVKHLQEPTEADRFLIEKAFNTAAEAHKEHKRFSGEPYMSHLAYVALRLAEMGMAPRTIAAGLLHDTIEDTTLTTEDIQREFGEEILFLVEGVTKLSSVRYYGRDRHNESLRKLFVATSQDIRVLIIKLVDRLHNMETLNHVPADKQLRIARETLEIYVPVAHRLGMGKIRKELEDLAFPYVYPEEYKRVLELLKIKTSKSGEILERERKILQKKLAESKLLNFHTSFRVKGLYSLFQKLKRKDWDIEQVYDLLAMRVMLETVEDCYRALGIIHEIWRPLPKRVKDYIAFPKPNGYQSIHTTVTTQSGTIMEIQIRTEKMHHEAEYGIASHMTYKSLTSGTKATNVNENWFANLIPSLFRPAVWRNNKATVKTIDKGAAATAKIPLWISQIGEMYTSEKASGSEFISDMREDFFKHRIFVFTPNGDVVDLPLGACPIDFAYAIHSEVGNKMSGAKVNNKLVSLDTELKNGDIVEIETSKKAKPTRKWLDMAKTSIAKRRIRIAIGEWSEQ
jgi:GTP diphosphokinase / guanosine-3',5'-bis(diphosphate) 3'-diphosphatase